MAHGPTRRSSGGSRRSSGGSRRSSSRSFSSRTIRHSGGTRIYHTGYGGRTIYRSSNQNSSPLSIILVFLIIAIIAFSFFHSSFKDNNAQLNYMKSDSYEFYDLVEKAKNGDPNYRITDAKILSVYTDLYYNGEYYYQIQYYFFNELTGKNTQGLTYYCYTYNEILKNNYSQNKTIPVAYSFYESINLDYKLENADYFDYKESVQANLIGMVISGVVIAACILIFVALIKKDLKKKNTTTTTTTTSQSDGTYNTTTTTTTSMDGEPNFNPNIFGVFENMNVNNDKYCTYCGSLIKNETKCPSCGANVKKQN